MKFSDVRIDEDIGKLMSTIPGQFEITPEAAGDCNGNEATPHVAGATFAILNGALFVHASCPDARYVRLLTLDSHRGQSGVLLHCLRICYAKQLRFESKTAGHLPPLGGKVPLKSRRCPRTLDEAWAASGRSNLAVECQILSGRDSLIARIWGAGTRAGRHPPVNRSGRGAMQQRARTTRPVSKGARLKSFEDRARNHMQFSAWRCPAPSVLFCVRNA